MSKRHSILIVADHASNFIPQKYNNLGLSQRLMKSHIAYDLGVKELSLLLSKKLKAPLVLGEYSRLLIDPNRGIMDPTLIPSISDGTQIVQNYKISNSDKRFRVNEIYKKHHNLISQVIKKKKINMIISLHSFNSYYRNKKRDIEFGILSNSDRRYSNVIIEFLSKKGYKVGDNQPYAGNLIEDTMYKHGLKNKIIHTLIETRNDLLLKPRDISSVANILYKAITSSEKRIKEYL